MSIASALFFRSAPSTHKSKAISFKNESTANAIFLPSSPVVSQCDVRTGLDEENSEILVPRLRGDVQGVEITVFFEASVCIAALRLGLSQNKIESINNNDKE